jgi:hypothetical protein
LLIPSPSATPRSHSAESPSCKIKEAVVDAPTTQGMNYQPEYVMSVQINVWGNNEFFQFMYVIVEENLRIFSYSERPRRSISSSVSSQHKLLHTSKLVCIWKKYTTKNDGLNVESIIKKSIWAYRERWYEKT